MNLSPDCRTGKHAACTGDAWEQAADMPTVCACSCHPPIEPMPADVAEHLQANVMAEVRRQHRAIMAGWDPGAPRFATHACWILAALFAVLVIFG